MRAVLMLAILAIGVPDREDPKKPETKTLQAELQGEWRMVNAIAGGNTENAEKVDGTMLIIKDKSMAIKEARRDRTENMAFTLDEAKRPVAIDLMPQRPGPKNGTEKVLGIAKIEGDTLTICFRRGGGGIRPTEFVSPPNSDVSVLQFKRVKK